MNTASVIPRDRQLKAPRDAAVAGVISAILFIVSLTVAAVIFEDAPFENREWLKENLGVLYLAINLVPFAGIFFLWFLGVARDRLGVLEDKFFATVFLGSGLLYLAMTFAATSMAFGLLTTYVTDNTFVTTETYSYSIAVIWQVTYVYGTRMAAVFMISTATMWLRTRVMPRWLAFFSYLVALVLLFLINVSEWIYLVFPMWMLIVSLAMLLWRLRSGEEAQTKLPGA